MAEKAQFDLEAELAALAAAAHRAAPDVSDALRARMLGDAAEVATRRAAAPGAARAQRARQLRREPVLAGARRRLFGLFDAWGAAAVGAVAACLMIGVGVGYSAGDEVLAEVGFAQVDVAKAGGGDDGYVLLEDVL